MQKETGRSVTDTWPSLICYFNVFRLVKTSLCFLLLSKSNGDIWFTWLVWEEKRFLCHWSDLNSWPSKGQILHIWKNKRWVKNWTYNEEHCSGRFLKMRSPNMCCKHLWSSFNEVCWVHPSCKEVKCPMYGWRPSLTSGLSLRFLEVSSLWQLPALPDFPCCRYIHTFLERSSVCTSVLHKRCYLY